MIKELYFLNSRELSKRLHHDDVSEDLAFSQLLVYSMIFASYIAIPVVVTCSAGENFSWWYQVLNLIVFASIQYWGMHLLYETNKSGDGKAFFLRLAALSLPVGIQVWGVGLALGAFYGGFIGFAISGGASNAPSYTWLLTGQLFGVLMQFIYFKVMQQNLTSYSRGIS
ncbi:MAG: hypothetical protein AB8B81_03735 [Halioglobus sp.]